MTFHLTSRLRRPPSSAVCDAPDPQLCTLLRAHPHRRGMLFERALDSMLQRESLLMLEQEWGDVLAYLNLNTDPPTWSPHADLPGQREVIARIRSTFTLSPSTGASGSCRPASAISPTTRSSTTMRRWRRPAAAEETARPRRSNAS